MTNFSHRQKGQALTEFAIVLSIFILILLVIVDLGRIAYANVTLQNATREGARYGVINPDNDLGIRTVTRDFAIGIDLCLACITVSRTTDTVTVSAGYDFRTATPVLQWLTGSTLYTVTSSSTMRIEQ